MLNKVTQYCLEMYRTTRMSQSIRTKEIETRPDVDDSVSVHFAIPYRMNSRIHTPWSG